MDHSPALYEIDGKKVCRYLGKKHIFMQSFQFDERRWQRTYTPRYQIDTTVVCARLAFEGMQALCYSHWRVCSGAVCLPISATTTGDVFSPPQSGDSYLARSLALSSAEKKHEFICDLPERANERSQSGSLVHASATPRTRIGPGCTCGGFRLHI